VPKLCKNYFETQNQPQVQPFFKTVSELVDRDQIISANQSNQFTRNQQLTQPPINTIKVQNHFNLKPINFGHQSPLTQPQQVSLSL
jgi:hypothetical protein